MAEARQFVQHNAVVLGQKSVGYFTTCMRLGYIAEDTLPDVSIHVDPVFGGLKPRNELMMIQKGHPLKTYQSVEKVGCVGGLTALCKIKDIEH